MVACKLILAVAFVFVAVVQIQSRPGADTEWSIPFEDELKNMSKQISSFVGDNAEYQTAAKNGLNTFVEGFKGELGLFTKSFDGKTGVSDLFKDSTKQFQTTIDNFVKTLPKDLTLKDFNEKTEQALKYMVEHGTEITKKAQGNTEVEKQIKDFIKKNIDSLLETTKAVQAKITEAKKA
ncbi:uncharacterized protein LOC111026481 [Myzus persicae]|uniref:uncharacterized protein LOC111026481 n=1 Tax=Myzus persicae TaxID=13164 RepID=UPI000B933C21|nr:uncharacterized protein LOC111026481 [Myzus persicae]